MSLKIFNKILVTIFLLFVVNTLAQSGNHFFATEGAGESVNLAEDSRVYSVVGLPFSGVSTSGDDILFSGILNMPIVIEMMLNDTPVCTNLGPIDSSVYGNVQIPYTVYDVTFDTLSFVLTLQKGDSTFVIPETFISGATSGIDSSLYSGTLAFLSDQYFPGQIVDSLRIGLTPKDSSLTGATVYTNWFSINNAADMNLASTSPVNGTKVSAFTGKTISVNLTGSSLDTSSFSATGFSVTGSLSGVMPYVVTNKSYNQIMVTLLSQPYGNETVSVQLLDTLLGISGKSILASGINYSWSFSTYKTGDFNGNDTIADLDDMVSLAEYWQGSYTGTTSLPVILNSETGPSVGTSPSLKVTEDSLFNYYDLLGFLKMWQWKTIAGRSTGIALSNELSLSDLAPLTLKEVESDETLKQPTGYTNSRTSRHQIKIDETDSEFTTSVLISNLKNIGAGEYILWYDSDALEVENVDFSESIFGTEGAEVFSLTEKSKGYIKVMLTALSKETLAISGPGVAFSVTFNKIDTPEFLTLQYKVVSSDKAVLDEGVISPMKTNDENGDEVLIAALPSPARPSSNKSSFGLSNDVNELLELTTHGDGVVLLFSGKIFPDDLKSKVAFVSINIYDALGNPLLERIKMPISVVNDKSYGYFWNGQNSNGRKVASGAYKAILKWECESKTGYEKTNIAIKGDRE